jgi:hypothetical protein
MHNQNALNHKISLHEDQDSHFFTLQMRQSVSWHKSPVVALKIEFNSRIILTKCWRECRVKFGMLFLQES